jgi:CheY-like chemotaxis protein
MYYTGYTRVCTVSDVEANRGFTKGIRDNMRKTVLVADDNQRIRKAACALLLHLQTVASCIEAENGLDALQKTQEMKPDLVILDFQMPVMDGIEAARRIHEILPTMPIVLFSLFSEMMTGLDSQGLGISAVVPKDQAASKLVPTVQLLLDLPSAKAS